MKNQSENLQRSALASSSQSESSLDAPPKTPSQPESSLDATLASPTSNAARIARTGIIAALYAALTLLTMTVLGGLSFGPVQLRVSEVVCVLALFTADAIPGLAIGCALANLIGIALNGSGALGLLDVVGGSAATLIGAWWCWRMRKRVGIALLGPVVANALIVSAYLPLMLAAAGFYTIPFTDISLVQSYPLMYAFGVIALGCGEALVIYGLGWPLQAALRRTPLFAQLTQP